MSLTAAERQAIVTDLTTNCDCWKAPGDREILNGLPDEKLATLKANSTKQLQAFTVANAAVSGVNLDGKHVRLNPETGKWEAGVIPANTETPANTPAQQPKKKKTAAPVANVGDDDEEALVENIQLSHKPAKKLRTLDELANSSLIDPSMQGHIQYLRTIETKEKDKVINQLLVNASPSERQAHYDRLMQRSLVELYGDLAIMPKVTPEDHVEAAVTANANRRRSSTAADDDMLVAPTISYRELDAATGREVAGKQPANNQASIDAGSDEPSLEEELSRLSPKARSMVENAQVVIDRERRQLIDQLIANVTDEAEEKRMVRSLSSLSLEQLRDFATVYAGRKEQKQGSYFGSGTPPLTNTGGSRSSAIDDDVLPLPNIDYSQESAMKRRA